MVRGGSGDDTVNVNAESEVVSGEIYDGGDGFDTLFVGGSITGPVDFSTSTLIGIELLKVFTGERVVMSAAQIDALTALESVNLVAATAGTIDLTDATITRADTSTSRAAAADWC